MDLTSNQLSYLMRRFPEFELSYETISHNKVSDLYDVCLAIPTGKKCCAWFTFHQDKNVCYLFELNREKKITKGRVVPTGYNTSLSLGTVVYGTIWSEGNTLHEPSNDRSFFIVEDILHFEGIPMKLSSFGERIGFLQQFMAKIGNSFEGNTSMASPSECFLDSLSRIPKGNPTTNENKFRPIEPILSEFSGAYSPKQPDTLFWSIFIIANGYGEYINIDRNYGVKELEIKKKVCDFLQKNPSKLKHTNYKITKAGVQEVISELLTSNKETSFNCLLALCVYYNINVVLIHPNGKLMLEFLSYDQEETPYYVLKKDTYGKYSVDTDKKTWKEVQEMKTQLICIVNYMKPMKAAGNYKMEDLEELAEKMGVLDATKKYKKAELYQLVSDSINWSRG